MTRDRERDRERERENNHKRGRKREPRTQSPKPSLKPKSPQPPPPRTMTAFLPHTPNPEQIDSASGRQKGGEGERKDTRQGENNQKEEE